MRRAIAALILALALVWAFPMIPEALAEASFPPPAYPDLGNASLPAARNNIGIGNLGAVRGSCTPVNPGSGYNPNGPEIVTLTGGTFTAPSKCYVTHVKLVTATLNNPGSGCSGSSGTLTGTTGIGTKFQLAATFSGGAVTAITGITVAGDYTANPAGTGEAVTGSSCSGVTVNTSMGVLTADLYDPGNYTLLGTIGSTVTMAQGSTSLSGSGATFSMSFAATGAEATAWTLRGSKTPTTFQYGTSFSTDELELDNNVAGQNTFHGRNRSPQGFSGGVWRDKDNVERAAFGIANTSAAYAMANTGANWQGKGVIECSSFGTGQSTTLPWDCGFISTGYMFGPSGVQAYQSLLTARVRIVSNSLVWEWLRFGSGQTGSANEFQIDGYNHKITATGDVLMTGLPTSCSGKASGTLWNNSGVLNVCP